MPSNTTEKTTKKLTSLRETALLLDKSEISNKEARENIENIVETTGFTVTRFSREDPNKMLYEGPIENSLLTLDRMPIEAKDLSMETWRKMRELIVSVQDSRRRTTEDSEYKNTSSA